MACNYVYMHIWRGISGGDCLSIPKQNFFKIKQNSQILQLTSGSFILKFYSTLGKGPISKITKPCYLTGLISAAIYFLVLQLLFRGTNSLNVSAWLRCSMNSYFSCIKLLVLNKPIINLLWSKKTQENQLTCHRWLYLTVISKKMLFLV